ncbi:MAG: family 10 glycosylhydrolase, partial [Acidimicrobiia bacterium]|nr:family 10 glycosylhydrolase [Acidimicrobiia bacterium]
MAGPTVIEDFSAGVSVVNHPLDAGQYGVWYDATNNAYGTASATTIGGVPAMRIDDGGFTNGVYAVYEGVVPTTGEYTVEAELHVVETGAVDAIRAYQLGVATGPAAAHRGPNPSSVAGLEAAGSYEGLTSGDDTGAGPQLVSTRPFSANAGDDLLVAFGTDVNSGQWNQNSGFWAGSYVVVTEIRLVPVGAQPITVDNDDGPGAYEEAGAWTTSGATGFNGGTYRYTSTGSESAATWSAQLPQAGSYDVEVIYVAGGNRATSAIYRVETVDRVVSVPVDQTTANLAWVRIGTFDLPAGPVAVTLDATASEPNSRVVIADAVRFVPTPVDDPEMRLAVVTVFDPIDDIETIQRTVDQFRDLHYNAIAVHSRFRGDATYIPNKSNRDFPNDEPRHPAAGDVDVLQEFTERGHRAGMKVFAYVNTHLVTDGSAPEARAEHVVNRHPDWITYEYNGGDPVRQVPGEGLWLEPALPAVTRYLAGIAGDIMSNYDCDGIILDRIRYPQTAFQRQTLDFGYHPWAIRRFNFIHGRQGVPDPSDSSWISFRQQAI